MTLEELYQQQITKMKQLLELLSPESKQKQDEEIKKTLDSDPVLIDLNKRRIRIMSDGKDSFCENARKLSEMKTELRRTNGVTLRPIERALYAERRPLLEEVDSVIKQRREQVLSQGTDSVRQLQDELEEINKQIETFSKSADES